MWSVSIILLHLQVPFQRDQILRTKEKQRHTLAMFDPPDIF